MEKRQNEVIEIDLLELFYALKKQILWIILAAIVGGTLAFAGTKLLMTPMYESTTTMLVTDQGDHPLLAGGSADGHPADQRL